MHYIDEIEHWAKAQLLVKLSEKKFKEVDKLSGSMGAYKTYENHYLKLRVICDRGIYNIEAGPSGIGNELWSIGFIKDYLQPATKGRWNLNLDQSLDFVISNYAWFLENFSKQNYKETFRKIDERCQQTF